MVDSGATALGIVVVPIAVEVETIAAVVSLVWSCVSYLTMSRPDFSSGSYSGGGNGSYSGGGSGGFRDDTSRRGFQEYDAGDDETAPRRSNSISSPARSSPTTTRRASTLPTAPAAPKAPEPVVDLLGMDDDAFGSTSTDTNANKALPVLNTQVVADGTSLEYADNASPDIA